MTRVVNLRKEPYDVYIGRPGHGLSGYFGNPVIPDKQCPVCGDVHKRGHTLGCYRTYLEGRVEQDDEFRDRVVDLHGKTLGCFCKPKPCHGDVLVSVINRLVLDEEYDLLF